MSNTRKRRDKGEGHWIYNKEKKTWTLRLGHGYKADGKRKVFTATCPTKDECRKQMEEAIRKWDRQNHELECSEKDTVTFLCECYSKGKRKLADKSRDREECTIQNQIAKYPLGQMQIQAVRGIDVENHIHRLIREGKLSASSIDKTLDVLNAAFNWAVDEKMIDFNPVQGKKKNLRGEIAELNEKNADDMDVKVLSEEEEALFVAEAKMMCKHRPWEKYPAGIYGLLLLYTGMRCGEMLSLRWGDIDFENRILRIDSCLKTIKNREQLEVDGRILKQITIEGKTKNKKARNVILTEEAIQVLQEIRKRKPNDGPKDYVVKTRTGKIYTDTQLENRIKTIFKNAGLGHYKGSLHIFRRTFATKMVKSGIDTKTVAEYIGDTEETLKKHYLASREKTKTQDGREIVVVDPWKKIEEGK